MEAEYKSQCILPIVLEGDSKVEHVNEWRTYRERNSQLDKQHGKALYMVQGQCMQVLLDNMKNYPD